MSGDYRIEWLIPQRVIYVHAWGRHNSATMSAYSQTIRNFIEQGTAPIHLISNDRDITLMPTLSTVQDSLSFSRHPHIGWIIAVGSTNRMVQVGSRLISRIFGVKFTRVATIEEAIALLASKDDTLNWNDADRSVLAES